MKNSAEQKPQDKMRSATRVQASKLLVASQRFSSCESTSCELRKNCELQV